MSRLVLGAVVLAGLVWTGVGRVGAEPPRKSDAVVKVLGKATAPDASGNQEINLLLKIDDGWHIYANPVGNEFFESAQTTVTALDTTGPMPLTVAYPPGKLMKDDGEEFRVYENE